jgi:hypothetical protein
VLQKGNYNRETLLEEIRSAVALVSHRAISVEGK